MKQYSQQQIKYISDNFQQGQRAIQLGQLSRAEKCYIDILKIGPDIIEAKNALAYIYTSTQQHEKAVAQLKVILGTQPNDSNAHHNLANNLFELQNYDEAIQHYQTAISLNPNFVEAHALCGIAHRKLKNYELAIRNFHQALNLDKVNAKVFHALGITYAEIGDYPRSVECLQNAIGLSPNNMEFNLCLGNVLEKSGHVHEADIQYHFTCSTFPNYADAFLLYGDLLTKNRHFNEALECFNHASKLAPHNLDILDNIGYSFLGLANTDMALSKFSYALSKEPKRISSLKGMEEANVNNGKIKEAIAICDQIISIDPTQITGYILKTKITKSKPDDGLAEQLEQLSDKVDLSTNDKIDLNFALGKVYDDQNNYQKAFKSYAQGNALRNNDLKFDREACVASFSELIEFFSVDYFKQHLHLGNESNLPILIVGMPRSGTTLTEQIISSHAKVAGAGEVNFWSDTSLGISLTINSKLPYPQCLNEMQTTHAKDVATRYESTLRKIVGGSSNTPHITDKMPHNFLNLGLIALLFPNVKIIHTKRDPIDTCLSTFFQNFNDNHPYTFDLSNLGFYYKQYERLMQHWHDVLPGRILDISYADTISDPEYWSRKLISHIGLEWDEACLSPHTLQRTVQTPSQWQVRQPIYTSSVQRWKNYEEFLEPLKQALAN